VGRTPIPPGLKILQGRSPGRDSGGRLVPAPPNLERGLPEPPAWLPEEVRAMWEVIAPQVDDLGVIKPQDGLGFTVLCECAATYAAAVVDLYAQGKVLINPKTGVPHKNPLMGVVETARRDLLRLSREFALTPLAETLLGKLPVPDDDDDPFGWEGTS
jgi:P27 family predicted phage terminase small subunit